MREAVRDLLTAWERGEWSAGGDLLAPDLHFSADQPEGRVEAVGEAEIAAFMRGFLDEWDDYSLSFEDLEEVAPDRFLASGRQVGRARTSGNDIDVAAFAAVTTAGGKIVRIDWFLERGEALGALGVRG